MRGGGSGSVFARVALIHISDLDRFSGFSLDSLCKFADSGAVLLVGGCDAQGKQVSQSINRQMDFIAFAALRAVVAGTPAALDRRLQRPAIEDRGGRHFLPAFGDAQDGAEVVDERFKDFGFDPSALVC